MVEGKVLVEKLLKYAKCFLHLNERDEMEEVQESKGK